MVRKLYVRLAVLSGLIALLIGLSFGGPRVVHARSECTDCYAFCRAEYDRCRRETPQNNCFDMYEDCRDFTCGPVCDGQRK